MRAVLLEAYENVRVSFDAGKIIIELPCGAALVDHMTYMACAHIIKTFPLHL
jgi:hypothetical protein